MVRVALGVTEGVEQPAELVGMVARRPDREVGSAEGRQQLEPCVPQLTSPARDCRVGAETSAVDVGVDDDLAPVQSSGQGQ